MEIPVNRFKLALKEQRPLIGLWVALADSYVAELLAGTGFDWLLIDGEHAPTDVRSALPQLQAIAPYPVQPIVRPVHGSVELIKQYLDIGVQTLLIPMVETAEQAQLMVAATRYPMRGIRGVGSALTRSSRWNQIGDYLQRSDEQMCVLVQAESVKALENLEAIASVEGVDGVFFGPADLSASMGLIGQPTAPAVHDAIARGITTVRKAGKAAGSLSSNPQIAREYLAMGAKLLGRGSRYDAAGESGDRAGGGVQGGRTRNAKISFSVLSPIIAARAPAVRGERHHDAVAQLSALRRPEAVERHRLWPGTACAVMAGDAHQHRAAPVADDAAQEAPVPVLAPQFVHVVAHDIFEAVQSAGCLAALP